MNDYLLNSEALIVEAQKLLSKKVGLSENKLEESEMFLIERGLSQHMMMLQAQLRAKVKYIIHNLDNLFLQQRISPSIWQRKSSNSSQRWSDRNKIWLRRFLLESLRINRPFKQFLCCWHSFSMIWFMRSTMLRKKTSWRMLPKKSLLPTNSWPKSSKIWSFPLSS